METEQKALPPLTKQAEELFVEAWELQETIKRQTEHLNEMVCRRDQIIEELAAKNIVEAGNYELLTKIDSKRKINADRFSIKYPDAYYHIVEMVVARERKKLAKTITIADATRILPSDTNIDDVCDTITTTKRVIVRKQIE